MSRPAVRDRVLAWLARFVTRRFFRSVERVGPALPEGPVILAASHLNGFVDPVLLVAELGLLPRFLAKATLWNVAAARPFLSFARIIPVHRRADTQPGSAPGLTAANETTFAAAVDALSEGQLLAVFPEGTTHDDPSLRPLRTGVARIARQAVASGVTDVRIVPVGVTYEDKVELRGRALVHFGEPLEVPPPTAGEDESTDHTAVRELTDTLSRSLNGLTPHFASDEDELGLTTAARVALRTDACGPGPVPLAQITDVARRLNEAGPEEVDGVVSATARYLMLLARVDLDDEAVVSTGALRTTVRHAVITALLAVVLAPFAIAGLFANLIPTILVLVAGLAVKAPVSKGTVRILVAFVAFPVTWAAIAMWDSGLRLMVRLDGLVGFPLDPLLRELFDGRSGFMPRLIVFMSLPLMGIAAIALVERTWKLVRDVLTLHTLINRRGQLEDLRASRAELVALTRQVLDGTG